MSLQRDALPRVREAGRGESVLRYSIGFRFSLGKDRSRNRDRVRITGLRRLKDVGGQTGLFPHLTGELLLSGIGAGFALA